MYSFEGRIRYSEIGQDKKLRATALLDYFQDCSMFQSEDSGVGIEFLEKEKQGWVLASWQIVMERMPELGEKVTISTWPYEFDRFLGKRNFLMQDENGEKLAYANSVWSFMDMEKKRPMKITDTQLQGYHLEEKLDMDYASRKIEVTGIPYRKEPVLITESRMDTNHHMNNGQYVRLAMEYLPYGINFRQIRVEYKKAVVCNDMMVPAIYKEEEGYIIALEGDSGRPCAILEFQEAERS